MFARLRWGRLGLRILAWSFVPTVIILGAVAAVTYYAYQDVTGRLVIGRNRELARLAAGQISTELQGYADLLDAESRTLALVRSDPIALRSRLQLASNRLAVFDGGTLILDIQGKVIATQPERPDIEGRNWADRQYYQSILLSDQTGSAARVFSDVVPDGPAGADVVAFAVPIDSPQGALVGALVGMFRIGATENNALYGLMVRLRLGDGGSAFVVDSNGRAIYDTDSDRIGADVSSLPDVQQVMAGQAGALRTLDLAGQDILSSFAQVPGTSWGLISHQGWSALMASSQSYRQLLLVLLALGVVVPALVVAIGVGRIVQPIRHLIGAAQKVAGGDFDPAISVDTGDEIEELADQFNRMAVEVHRSYAQLEERAEARDRELATLNAIAAVVSQSADLNTVLNEVLKDTLNVVDVEAGGIYLLDEEAGVLTVAAYQGVSPAFVADIDRLKVGEGFSGRVAESGQPLVLQDVSADPRLTRQAVREEQVHSLAVVPLSSKGKALGTLFAMTHGYREFTDQDVQLLTSIGRQIGIAVENARLLGQATQRMQQLEGLYRAEQRRAEQFRLITEVGQRITSLLPLDELLHQMAHLIREAFDYYHVGIGLIEGDEVVYRIGAGKLWEDPSFRFRPARLGVGKQGITGFVAATGEPLLVRDVSQEPRYVWMQGSQTRSELTLPIMIKGQVFGVLDVQSDQLNAFDDADLAVLQSLAHQAAIAIENVRLYEQAQQVAVMEERNRLARDLHDAVTQTLFSASLIAEAVPDLWQTNPAEGRELLEELRRLSRGALAEMRTLLLELRPAALIDTGLGDLLRQLGEAVAGRTGASVTVSIERVCALPSDVHVALYRIAQEGLNNVVKHANAHRVSVGLRCTLEPSDIGGDRPASAQLEIQDDGRGFELQDVPANCLGLGIIRERAEAIGAQLEIESKPGQGTRITAVWTRDAQRTAKRAGSGRGGQREPATHDARLPF